MRTTKTSRGSFRRLAHVAPVATAVLVAIGLSSAATGATPLDLWELERRARDGDVAAQLRLGRLYAEGVRVELDYAHSVAWFQIAADSGDVRGRFELGMKYFSGKGVTRDYARAAELIGHAAEAGLADAQYRLGMMRRRGLGMSIDYGSAAAWLRRAADQGHPLAHARLAAMYLDGVGVARDAVEAYVLFSVAAAKGVSSARPRRIQAKRKLNAAELARAKRLAAERLAKLERATP